MKSVFGAVIKYFEGKGIIDSLKLDIGILPNCPDKQNSNRIHVLDGLYDETTGTLVDHNRNYTEYTFFLFRSYEENLLSIQREIECTRLKNSMRYNRLISYHLDEDSLVVFSILHEIGHCVHNFAIKGYEADCPDDVIKAYCSVCPYRFNVKDTNCNNTHEFFADQFAIKYLGEVVKSIKGTSPARLPTN